MQGLRQAGDVVDLDYPLFFIDRVKDAVAPDPQAPQIRRPVWERLRQPPGGFGPSRQNCEFVCRAIHAAT